jgi:glucosamine--fructose-6-phosphate aminotransferase (isomerizing)
MCGIVGYYGDSKQVQEALLSGLKRLEYRGYDSAGIATPSISETYICKAVGKIAQLELKLQDNPLVYSSPLGIAHTRWATHGVPNEVNAHPHISSDHRISLVHNGIIENYQELKMELKEQGLSFQSDTDTEVLANLIASQYQDDLKKAVQLALKRVRGAFAIVVFAQDEPDCMIAAKLGSPLVMGVGTDEFILASDVSAMIHKTREVIYLEDGEIVTIKDGSYEITSFDNQNREKQIERVDWDADAASKDGFDHFLIKEIHEQPRAVQDSIRGRIVSETGTVKFGGLIDVHDQLRQINHVSIVGIGTSYYAGLLGRMYMEELAGVQTQVEMSPEFRYKHTIIDPKTWVIALSQSGETADTIAAIQEAQRKGAFTTGIVNTVGSTIARITDAGVYNHIGPEVSVASTKAFTSQSVILLMHAILLGRLRSLDYAQAYRVLKAVEELPNQLEQVLQHNELIAEIAAEYVGSKNMMYIGRNFNYPIALEGALKLKEISYIHAEGLSSGELKHGFIALIEPDFPTVVLATKDSVYEKTVSNIQEVKARNGKVLAIGHGGDVQLASMVDHVIPVPQTQSIYTQPILNNVALQLFAYHCSRLKGLDVDKPRNLAKSVTVE